MVARKNENVFGVVSVDKVNVLINGICCALVPFGTRYLLIGGENVNAAVGTVEVPGLSVSDVVVQFKRLILGQNTDGIDAGIHAV